MSKSTKIILAIILITVITCSVCVIASAQDTVYYGKSQLEGNEAYVYSLLESDVLCDPPKQDIELDTDRGVTAEQMQRAISLFLSDHPECFWMDEGVSYSYRDDGVVTKISPRYTVSVDSISNMKKELDAVVNSIFSDMPDEVKEGTNYKKALYLHDALAIHTSYEQVGSHQTAYGALVSKKAVCAGYAAAYQLLLQRAGIPAWTVSGDAIDPTVGQPVAHAWNVLWINGQCVYTDVTWDDQGDELYRIYFNASLEQMQKTHFVDSSVYELPACGHDSMSYFTVEGSSFEDSDGAEEFAKLFSKQTDGTYKAEFLYEGENLKSFLDENILDIFAALGGKGSVQYRTTSVDSEIHLVLTGDFSGDVTVTPNDYPTADVPDYPTEAPLFQTPTEDEGASGGQSGTSTEANNQGSSSQTSTHAKRGCSLSLGGASVISATLVSVGVTIFSGRKSKKIDKDAK